MSVTSIVNILNGKNQSPSKPSDLEPGLIDLTEFQCINVTGEEALTFLQGQFTNHILDMSIGSSQITGYCNPKGRALAVLWLLRREDGCYLLAPADLMESLLKRLQMFKMRARVSLELELSHCIYGIVDPTGHNLNIDDSLEKWTVDESRAFVSVSIGQRDLWLEKIDAPLLGHDYWRLGQILAAEPMVYASTSEALIPQHMNLDLVNGVSFTKGCYPGQEIIARLRYLGKLKQRMIIGVCEGSSEISAGAPVFTQEKGEQKAGIVVDAVRIGNVCYVSVNVTATHIYSGDIAIGDQKGAVLQRFPMPYLITLEKKA